MIAAGTSCGGLGSNSNAASPRTCREPEISESSFLDKCLSCSTAFTNDALFCRKCGEQRLKFKEVADVFKVHVGSRTVFRKTDLSSLTFKVKMLQEGALGVDEKSFHWLAMALEQAYEEVLAFQLQRGTKCSQGLTLENFQDFLMKIAVLLGVTCNRVILWLLDE